MATTTFQNRISARTTTARAAASVEELLLEALNREGDTSQTGRYLVTFKEGTEENGLTFLTKSQGLRVADACDFDGQAAPLEAVGDADAVFMPAIGVALLAGKAAQERGLNGQNESLAANLIESVDAECFVHPESSTPGQQGFDPNNLAGTRETGKAEPGTRRGLPELRQTATTEFLRGFLEATRTIAEKMRAPYPGNDQGLAQGQAEPDGDVAELGATWGLTACRVPLSPHSGKGIKVAVLDSGFDLGHPDFVGRSIVSMSFVGQPVQDLLGHGTRLIGTACGPKAPAGSIPRYGIGFRSSIFVGKVLTNAGTGTMGNVLMGINWAIANQCPVIMVGIGTGGGPNAAFTAAGQAALNKGCLLIAGAGSGSSVGVPANSPTILSVGAVNQRLQPAPFSPPGKIDLAAPGVDIFSASSRPGRYGTASGTTTAAAHVAGCAALWAETSPSLRGLKLWQQLEKTAKRYPPFFPPYPPKNHRLGAGLVQAPS